jgi:uncharacterized circularly permuted ATP-grasp superfamily protein
VRSHWRSLVDGVFEDDARAARRATEFTRRMIVENGITYNVYADAQGRDRPWILDPLPYLMTAEEWQNIEAGVAQRAALLNSVLADLYGPQELLAQGALPAEIPFGHPNFLWPCVGVRPPQDRWLSLYAADLARSADGRWWVLADRTQGPSGPGYALENRQIVRRAFPHLAQAWTCGRSARSSQRCARSCCAAPAMSRSRSCSRRLVQRDLLRARLSRAPARLSPGRGPRSHRP